MLEGTLDRDADRSVIRLLTAEERRSPAGDDPASLVRALETALAAALDRLLADEGAWPTSTPTPR